MSKEDGGPAFPVTRRERVYPRGFMHAPRSAEVSYAGMSLRDYFAAKAMPALISAMMDRRHEADFADFDQSAIAEAARLAFAAADDAIHWRDK